jgi:hypothetical protein
MHDTTLSDNTTDANGTCNFEEFDTEEICRIQLILFISLSFLDIMLVKLQGPAAVTPQSMNFDPLFPSDGTEATVTGYGYTVEGGTPSFTLQEAAIPIVSFNECDSFWNKLDEPTQICTGTFWFITVEKYDSIINLLYIV